MEGTHRKLVILPLVGSEMPTKVGEGVEGTLVVKAFLIFTVAAFHLTVMARCVRMDQFMADTQLLQRCFKKGWFVFVSCRPFSIIS